MKTKKFIYTAVLACLFAFEGMGQFGAAIKYQLLSSSPWITEFEPVEEKYPAESINASLHYWFRLKEKRIEFLPEVGYYTSIGNGDRDPGVSRSGVFADFNTDIYLFDLLNDCNCPTFSKQSGGFQRSFFLEASPGLEYQSIVRDAFEQEEEFNDNAWLFRLGIGVGFDIGVSDLLTLTPLIKGIYRTTPDWNLEADITGSEWVWNFGIRATFRPDYVNRYR